MASVSLSESDDGISPAHGDGARNAAQLDAQIYADVIVLPHDVLRAEPTQSYGRVQAENCFDIDNNIGSVCSHKLPQTVYDYGVIIFKLSILGE